MIDKDLIWKGFERLVIIAGWSFIGWLAGYLIFFFAFGEAKEIFGGIIGIVLGFLWGLRSNTYWVFV